MIGPRTTGKLLRITKAIKRRSLRTYPKEIVQPLLAAIQKSQMGQAHVKTMSEQKLGLNSLQHLQTTQRTINGARTTGVLLRIRKAIERRNLRTYPKERAQPLLAAIQK